MCVRNFIIAVVALLLSGLNAGAQLCTGSLGDPVVNIDFGTAANPGTGYTAPPGYTYTGDNCPNDGSYTITSRTSGCFGGNWHTVNNDHTGGGSFLLVNASYQPADFFVQTVSGLCPSTTYQFSAWVINVLKSSGGIMPNLTFKIETTTGVVLAQYNTGDIPAHLSPTWEEYGFFVTTTAGVSDIVLRITNNAPGGNGNDLGLDDITFRPCGPTLISNIQGGSALIDVCDKDQTSYDFSASISAGFNQPVYQWQVSTDSGAHWTDIPGANTLSFHRIPGTAGVYWYRLTVAESGNAGISACRIASNILRINVHAPPVVNAGPDRSVLTGFQITLQASVTGESATYLWSPSTYLSDATALQPVFTPGQATQYTLTASTTAGCSSSDVMNVTVVAGIFVPTGFSPNNDGINDHWRIPFLDPQRNATVTVYNRWGNTVYTVKGNTVDWDGNCKGIPQPAGTYIYLIRFPDKTPDMKGSFQLIR